MTELNRDVYAIFSIDTEHDIVSRYRTRCAGWDQGLPLLFDVFDTAGLRGKVCWLIEYNMREGIPAANPYSVFYTPQFPNLIKCIKERQDGIGLHPTLMDWVGGDAEVNAGAYIDASLWDGARRLHDPGFVMEVISSATREVVKTCSTYPVGCRTGGMLYGVGLAAALEENRIYVDSSVLPLGGQTWNLMVPQSYYASADDIRRASGRTTHVLEIPTNGYIQNLKLLDTWVKLRCRLWVQQPGPVFLSFFIHNWQAVLPDGSPDRKYLNILSGFLEMLLAQGVRFLGWPEACRVFKDTFERTIEEAPAAR